MYQVHKDFNEYKPVTRAQLDQILDTPVLNLDGLDYPIIIKKIELLFNHGNYIVRTISEDGLEGISLANDRMEFCYPILEKQVAPYFIGQDARRLEALLEEVYVYKANYKLAGIPYYSVLAALELSILDMLAKARNVSMVAMFGDRLKDWANLYVASGNRQTTPEEELEIIKARVDKSGAKAIKFKIGGRMSRNKDSMEGRSEGLIYKSREFFGDGMIIHADGNGSYDVETAVKYGKMLEEINAYFYEEPCPFDDLESTRDVTAQTKVPLAFGEQENSMTRFRWLVENHGCDVVQPDIFYNGGLIRTTKVAKMAQLAGMTITPHVSSGFCFVYLLYFAAYTPNIGQYLENKEGLELANDFLIEPIVRKDGRLSIPDLKGVGVDASGELIREAIVLFDIH